MRFRVGIHYKITFLFCVILAVIFAGTFIFVDSTVRGYVNSRIRSALIKETLLVKLFLEEDFPGYPRLKEIDSVVDKAGSALDARVTIIGLDGIVLGDSEMDGADLKGMENHLYRPEVQEALRSGNGLGESMRFSTTIQKHMLYIAAVFGKSKPEGVVRLSLPLPDIAVVAGRLKHVLGLSFFLTFLVAVLASLMASFLVTRPLKEISGITKEIAKGDFSRKITSIPNDEVGDLARAVNEMSEQIKQRIDVITSSRSRFEAVLLSMFDGIMVVDAKGLISLMNPKLMSSLAVKGNPAGKKPLEVLRNIEVQELTDSVLEGGEGVESREISIMMPAEKIFMIHATPITRERETEGAVLVFHDITALRSLEKIRKDFVANVSHELRTPASNIKGYAETLLDGALEDKENAEEFIRIIESDAERLASLISDLLDLSKIESGRLDLELAPCSIDAVAARVVREVDKQARKKSIRVVNEVPPGLPEVLANEAMISQAILNLMDNAVKYTPAEGTVRVSAREEDGTVRLEVSDTGVGIAKEDLPRIFERFYRVDKARSRELGGTGLGLSIVKHIVQEHGGEVFVESELEKGSTFSFSIPKA